MSEKSFIAYLDFEGMTRKAIDQQTSPGPLKEFCNKNTESINSEEKINFEKIDCIYFKH
jgi:hypothetical protein